ncbi:hypothetical protein AtNW77_Chr1g0039821 [Arabidopsis thaliana]
MEVKEICKSRKRHVALEINGEETRIIVAVELRVVLMMKVLWWKDQV